MITEFAQTTASAVRHRAAYLVFSDVDETLIDCKSMFDFLRFQLVNRLGDAGEQLFTGIRNEIQHMAAAGVPRAEVNRAFYSRAFAGESAVLMEQLGRAWFAERSAQPGFFIDSTVQELRRHHRAGADIVLVSGSFAPCLQPIGAYVGAARVLGTAPVIERGLYTGKVVEPVIGEGKRAAVLRTLADYPEVSPQDCYAYGDHVSDLPMLDCVGHPRGVGSDPQLVDYLLQRGARAHRPAPGSLLRGDVAVACWSMGCEGSECAQGSCP